VAEAALLAALTLLGAAQGDLDDDGDDASQPPAEATAAVSGTGTFDDYQLAQVQRTEVLDGPVRVAVETGAPAPRAGGMPLRVFLENTGPATTVALRFNATSAGHQAERAVALGAGERRTVTLPVMAEMHYGVLTASAPGAPSGAATVFLHPSAASTRVVLCLGRPEAFELLAGHAPSYTEARTQVLVVPPAEAPDELLAYSGFEAVVLPEGAALDGLDEAQRRALEAYAATGGALVLGGTQASGAALPLLAALGPGRHAYGFGVVHVVPGETGGQRLTRAALGVTPHGPISGRSREVRRPDAVLPQAAPPLGRFLLIIALFTLAIGPGSAWVAQRWRPATLLLTIPATALVTSALLVGYSLVADGFTLHAASYGLTLLDGPRHRAITLGLDAYYANLGPGGAHYPALTAVLGPPQPGNARSGADLVWRDGLTLGPDFIPSRVYREWGLLSVEPTRARLVLRQRGSTWVVQNALGHKVAWVLVGNAGGRLAAEDLADGAEQVLRPAGSTHAVEAPVEGRFPVEALRAVGAPLGPGEFVARLEGAGFVPAGGLSPELARSGHYVRGEVER
jgi:hypothetical protein